MELEGRDSFTNKHAYSLHNDPQMILTLKTEDNKWLIIEFFHTHAFV